MDEGIQLFAIRDRAIRLRRTRTSGVKRCTQSKRDVSGLITTEGREFRPCKLTMEQSIQLSVFGCYLTIRNLKTIRLYTPRNTRLRMGCEWRTKLDVQRYEVVEQRSERAWSSRNHCWAFWQGRSWHRQSPVVHKDQQRQEGCQQQ